VECRLGWAHRSGGRLWVVSHAVDRLEERVLLGLEVRAEDGLHPVGVGSEPVEVVSPFAELDGVEHAGLVEHPDRRFILPAEHAGAPLKLHAAAVGRVVGGEHGAGSGPPSLISRLALAA
jgi:hypothetical protein